MPQPEIRAIEFPSSPNIPKEGTVDVELKLADGTSSKFKAATPDQPKAWLEKSGKGYAFGDPVLFVGSLEPALLREASEAMAHDLGGYWLRYYHARKPAAPAAVTQASIPSPEAPGSGVIQVTIKDGRIFSILAATPAWFKSFMEKKSLRFYFGPSILFLEDLNAALARRAVSDMAAKGDHWLCLYDTPRTTASKILTDFKIRHK